MAHIKVERRGMTPDEWTDIRFGWLKKYIYRKKYEIKNMKIAEARQVTERGYEYYVTGNGIPDAAEAAPGENKKSAGGQYRSGEINLTDLEYRPLRTGDTIFSPDGTVFIRAKVTLPEKLRHIPLWFVMRSCAEFIVKINGRYAGGIDPNRDRLPIPLSDGGMAPETLKIDMEGYNRSKPDDERNPEIMSRRGCRQVWDGAYIAVLNNEILDLIYDFEALINIRDSECFSADYRAFLSRELSRAMDLISFPESDHADDLRSPESLAEAKQYIEEHIYSDKTYFGQGKVALVGHSHLDIAYYWRRIHSVQKNMRTVLIQLRLMERYPEFRYVHTQPYLYEMLERYYPDVFEELKKAVQSGQFEPAGGMYVEPDCNIPSAESLVRQCLYGQLAYERMFGKTVNNAWLPDVFGNSWILPQILRKSGMDYFVSNKMSTWNDTNRFPHNSFIWRGIDGSEVMASVPPTHFISWNEPEQVMANWDAFRDKDTGGATLNMFGYGDGGSGATEEMLELARRFRKIPAMPRTKIMGGQEYLERHLGAKRDKLAVWDGELYLEMHRGTFTTKSVLKYRNRRLEFRFRDTELLSALTGADSSGLLTPLYKRFLVNQFHDILPGSHIRPVYEDAVADYDGIEGMLDKLQKDITGRPEPAQSGERRAERGDTVADAEVSASRSQNSKPYFNTLNFKRRGFSFIEDPDGADMRHGKAGYWSRPAIEGLGCGEAPVINPGSQHAIRCTQNAFENEYYRVKFNPDGSFKSLWDKMLLREWTDGEFNKLKLYDDRPGRYDAWDIQADYKKHEIPYRVEEPLHFEGISGGAARFSVTFATEKSRWVEYIRFFADSREIETEHVADWHESHVLAKMQYDCSVLTRKALCDTSAGFIERDTVANTSWQAAKFETCMHKWCDLSETNAGVAIINEGKYGVSFDRGSMAVSLLRATERPDTVSDTGEHDFCLMIYPHDGTVQSANVNKLAFEYNCPLLPVSPEFAEKLNSAKENRDGLSAGTAVFYRLMEAVGERLYLQAVKLSEDGTTLVVRLSEQDGARGSIILPGKFAQLDMLEKKTGTVDRLDYGPFEIITLGIRQ